MLSNLFLCRGNTNVISVYEVKSIILLFIIKLVIKGTQVKFKNFLVYW